MLRSLCLPLLGLAFLAQAAVAQTTPAKKPVHTAKFTPRPASAGQKPAARRNADPLAGTNDGGKGQSGYAAPGEPIEMPSAGGKNTASYDGQPAAKPKGTALPKPK